MKRLVIILLFFTVNVSFSYGQNTDITNLVNQINPDSIRRNVEYLENFHSRYAFSNNRRDIAYSLKQRLENYGFIVTIDSFYISELEFPHNSGIINSGWQYNVLSLKQGNNTSSDSSLFLGAHYDCISNRLGYDDYVNYSPGADDNASSVASLLEIARVWNNSSINQRHNLRIEFYSAEELGLNGSSDRVYKLANPWQTFVIAMINLDMIGNQTENDSIHKININYYDNSDWLTNLTVKNTRLYSSLEPNLTQEYINSSDSRMFYLWGLNTIFLTENEFSPYYHTPQDSSTYLNYNYMKQISSIALSLCYDLTTKNYSQVGLNLINNISDNNLDILSVSNNEIDFELTNNKFKDNTNIYLINTLGQKILKKSLSSCIFSQNKYKIDISSVNCGIYTLIIKDKNTLKSKKIVKIAK